MQNPVTNMLGQHNACREDIIEYVIKMEDIIKGLNPVLIYLNQSDIRKTIERISLERPKEWIEGFIAYHTQQGYGKAFELQGFDGMLEVMKVRKSIELEIFDKLSMTKLMLDNSDYNWDRCNNLILEIL